MKKASKTFISYLTPEYIENPYFPQLLTQDWRRTIIEDCSLKQLRSNMGGGKGEKHPWLYCL